MQAAAYYTYRALLIKNGRKTGELTLEKLCPGYVPGSSARPTRYSSL
jgi:hypothetical protein